MEDSSFEVEKQRSELELTRKRFQFVTIVLFPFCAILVLLMLYILYTTLDIRTYRDRELMYVLDEVRESSIKTRSYQEEIRQRIADMELRHSNLRDYSNSLNEGFQETQTLLRSLQSEIKELKEGANK